MTYYLIVAIQAFCVYHLFKNKNDYYWLFAIIFLPLIGCIIYMVTQVYNKRDVDTIQKDITTIINPTKKVKDLDRKLQFSETYQNRVDLADAFFEMKDFNNAIKHYQIALNDTLQNQYHVYIQLIACYHYENNYQKVIEYAEKVKNEKQFVKTRAQFLYGLALNNKGHKEEAEQQLRQIDTPYNNYEERLELVRFLKENDKAEDAETVLKDLYVETQNLTKMNKRKYRNVIVEIEKFHKAF